MITTADLATYVGADAIRDESALERSLAAANAQLDLRLASAWRGVPEALRDVWTLDVASNYFKRGATSDGGFLTAADGTGVPGVANDPLQKVWGQIKAFTNRL